MSNRLALGTAQFGLTYGVANEAGQVPQSTIEALLARAFAAGVDTLDTAVAYGTSEACLGKAGVTAWHVITKLPALPADVHDVSGWVHSHVRGSLERLSVATLDGLLLHRPSDLLGASGRSYQHALQMLKAEGLVRAVGISVYDPAEIAALWPTWQPDIVQAPCNVLDQRLIRSGWLAKLSDRGVRVHVRSVFLQGLLLMSASLRPKWFSRWDRLLNSWLEWCGQQGIPPLRAALGFVQAQAGIERLVIGVESLAQLEEILAALVTEVPVVPDGMYCNDLDLIEPSRWRLA